MENNGKQIGERRIEFKKETKPSSEERPVEFGRSPAEKEGGKIENLSERELIVEKQLRREIEMMKLDEGLKKEAEDKAKKIELLGEKEKIEHLLEIARQKGLTFAVNVAKEMKDPYILDVFHDILAKEGYYNKFIL